MTAASNIIEKVSEPDNVEKLKKAVNNEITSTLESNGVLGKYNTNVNDLLDKYAKYINPEEYYKTQKGKTENSWNKIVTQLRPHLSNKEEFLEGFIEGNTGSSVDEFTANAVLVRHQHFRNNLRTKDYQNQCEVNINNTINEFLEGENGEKTYFNKLKNIISSNLKAYRDLYEYKSTMGLLKNGKYNELKKIRSKIDTYSQNLFMDSRKSKYENKNYEFYKNIHFYLLIIYYSFFVLFLIFSNFIQEQQYYNKLMLFYLILYLIFPIILPYILVYLKYLYVYYLEFNNDREEIVSYPDLANKYYDKIE